MKNESHGLVGGLLESVKNRRPLCNSKNLLAHLELVEIIWKSQFMIWQLQVVRY